MLRIFSDRLLQQGRILLEQQLNFDKFAAIEMEVEEVLIGANSIAHLNPTYRINNLNF